MASEIRVNKINSSTGVGTITLSPTGVDISGITTVSTLKVGTGASSRKNAVTWMINLLKENKSIDLYDKGEVLRDFLHVNDVCEAINLICEKGKKNDIYNVSSGHPVKIKYLIDLAYEFTNSSSKINFINEPDFHSLVQNKDFWMENTKLKELGFIQRFPLEKIVQELCE